MPGCISCFRPSQSLLFRADGKKESLEEETRTKGKGLFLKLSHAGLIASLFGHSAWRNCVIGPRWSCSMPVSKLFLLLCCRNGGSCSCDVQRSESEGLFCCSASMSCVELSEVLLLVAGAETASCSWSSSIQFIISVLRAALCWRLRGWEDAPLLGETRMLGIKGNYQLLALGASYSYSNPILLFCIRSDSSVGEVSRRSEGRQETSMRCRREDAECRCSSGTARPMDSICRQRLRLASASIGCIFGILNWQSQSSSDFVTPELGVPITAIRESWTFLSPLPLYQHPCAQLSMTMETMSCSGVHDAVTFPL